MTHEDLAKVSINLDSNIWFSIIRTPLMFGQQSLMLLEKILPQRGFKDELANKIAIATIVTKDIQIKLRETLKCAIPEVKVGYFEQTSCVYYVVACNERVLGTVVPCTVLFEVFCYHPGEEEILHRPVLVKDVEEWRQQFKLYVNDFDMLRMLSYVYPIAQQDNILKLTQGIVQDVYNDLKLIKTTSQHLWNTATHTLHKPKTSTNFITNLDDDKLEFIVQVEKESKDEDISDNDN